MPGVLPALALLATFGCAHGSSAGGPASSAVDRRLEVLVVNGTGNNLRIYVMDGGEVLIGRVSALSERSLRLPPGVAGTLRLVARPAAGMDPVRRHVSEPFVIDPGQHVTWRLQGSPGITGVPRTSTIRVRPER